MTAADRQLQQHPMSPSSETFALSLSRSSSTQMSFKRLSSLMRNNTTTTTTAAAATTRRSSSSSSLSRNRPPHLNLPLELWVIIVLAASTSLKSLAAMSTLCRSIREMTWSTFCKALVLARTSPTTISHDFFAFVSLPDGEHILELLIRWRVVTVERCPRAVQMLMAWSSHDGTTTNSEAGLRRLVDRGFAPEGSTIVLAANRGYLSILNLILSKHSQLPIHPFALTAAAAQGHTHVVEYIMRNHPTVPVEPLALTAAAGAGHAPCVRLIVSHAAFDPHDDLVRNGMRQAARKGFVDVVAILDGVGVRDVEALTGAIASGCVSVVRFLVTSAGGGGGGGGGDGTTGTTTTRNGYPLRKADWAAARRLEDLKAKEDMWEVLVDAARRGLAGRSGRVWALARDLLVRTGRRSSKTLTTMTTTTTAAPEDAVDELSSAVALLT